MESDAIASGREWRFRLALIAVSLALAFGLAEVALRLIGVGARRATTDNAGFTFFAYHPRLGWDLVPGARDQHRSEEFDVEIAINSQGLRASRDYPPTPPEGVRRLLVLGDSFTFGHGVEAKEAWPALLEAARPDLEVVNLAVTGYGTDQQVLRFEQRSDDFAPDAVIVGLFEGNVFRNARFEQLGYAKPRFVLRRGELILEGVPVPRTPPRAGGSRLVNLLGGAVRTLEEHLGYGEAWPVTGAILDRLAARCAAKNIPLFVVALPKDQLIYGSGPRLAVHERARSRLQGLLDEHQLTSLDLVPALRLEATAHPETRLYYAHDGHWTVAGHRTGARAIDEWLRPLWPPQEVPTPPPPTETSTPLDPP